MLGKCLGCYRPTKWGGKIEHIIVDDGSSDHSLLIATDFAKSHPYARVISFDHNKGTNAARNTAIKAARGKWCIILDSDDYFKESALVDIISVMSEKSGYQHYMFAADDMVGYYANNKVIKGRNEAVLTYEHFLKGEIGGDFIHVCNRNVLLAHPFDERLRIYEGIFFLMFYRDIRSMFFTNKVVTIRERERADSVTRETFRTNRKVIRRAIISNELYLQNFEEELKNYGFEEKIEKVKANLLDNYVLMGRYAEANQIFNQLKNKNKKILIIHSFGKYHLGVLYRLMLKAYLIWKYKIRKAKMGV